MNKWTPIEWGVFFGLLVTAVTQILSVWRSAKKTDVVIAQNKEIKDGVDLTHKAVNSERTASQLEIKALREQVEALLARFAPGTTQTQDARVDAAKLAADILKTQPTTTPS